MLLTVEKNSKQDYARANNKYMKGQDKKLKIVKS